MPGVGRQWPLAREPRVSPGRQCPAASPTQGSAVLPTPGSPSPGSRFPPGSRFSARLPFAPQLPVPAAVVPVPSSPRLSLGLRFHPRAELPVPFVPRSSVPSSAPLSSPIPACLSFPRHQHPRFPFRPELLFASRFPFPAGSSSLPVPTFHPVPGAAPFPRFPSPFPFPFPVPFPRSLFPFLSPFPFPFSFPHTRRPPSRFRDGARPAGGAVRP